MADRWWGDHPTNEDMPLAQTMGYVGGATAPNVGGVVFDAGWFTMPWTGNLTATATAECRWTGHQQASVHYWNSSPAPTSSSWFNEIAINGFGEVKIQIPLYAAWSNLTKGTTVYFKIYLGVGGGGSAVTCNAVGETVRAWPSGNLDTIP